ncbi:MAG: hypothetical protein A2W91_17625 [Bacteroidetes bacterium GWF2_38_335]|nr:MAG: hypothetical protein A2W91_17625 [Bacteroidetes bacterium GWF2_38_335]
MLKGKQTMKTLAFIFLLITVIMLFDSCRKCKCSDFQPGFTDDEKEWIPIPEENDTIFFECGDSVKTFIVTYKNTYFEKPSSEAPWACICPEDGMDFYYFEMLNYKSTNYIEELKINLEKDIDGFSMHFFWKGFYNDLKYSEDFTSFDYSIDSVFIGDQWFHDVYYKILTDSIELYFHKSIGLIKYKSNGFSWEILN